MKIDEFINKANRNDEVVVNRCDSLIRVYDNENDLLFSIPLDATNFLGIDWFTSYADDFISKETSKYLSELIEEFLHTPIKERYPEKKYRLRWIDDEDGTPNYLKHLTRTLDWELTYQKDFASTFTEKELQQLKINNPRFAPAIDAMKEQVEDD